MVCVKIFEQRSSQNAVVFLNELKSQSEDGRFHNFCRCNQEDFERLLILIQVKIGKKNTNCREAISPRQKLAVTLRYLATGDSYASLIFFFRISKSAISKIIPEVCQALISSLRDYVQVPQTHQEWLSVAQEFHDKWGFPHCIGAIDGKHCVIQAPVNSGSDYFNYKNNFSIVLLAIVDANYNFIYADVGSQGRISDGGVFRKTEFYSKLQNNKLNLPPDDVLPGSQETAPYVFLADDAFPLQKHIMKPYSGSHEKNSPKRIYNYRVSRARRVVENTFGIMSSVFRILRKPILLKPQHATTVILSCVYLHNFLRKYSISYASNTPVNADEGNNSGAQIMNRCRPLFL